MRKNGNPSLGDIYGDMLGHVQPVTESTIKKGGNDFGGKVPLIKGGPQTKGGFHKSLHDQILSMYDEPSQDLDEDEETGEDTEVDSEEEETDDEDEDDSIQESQKVAQPKLNTSMSRKLTFDNLFNKLVKENFDANWGEEDAENDIDALGLGDADPDSDLGDDFGDEGGEETVNLSLDRVTAQALYDLLGGVLGGGEEDGDLGEVGDEGGEFGGDEGGDGLNLDEDEETIGAKDGKGGGEKQKLQNKSNKVNGKPQPSGGGATDFKPTDKVGNDGDHGHALHGAKQPNIGKSNKVSNLKQGAEFFK